MGQITTAIHEQFRASRTCVDVTRVVRAGPYTACMTQRTSREIRSLLEANLDQLEALTQLHKRKLKALNETRALLFIALKELIVANDNERTNA